MPPDRINRDSSIKASPGSKSGVRKFTLSCSRCRASKLKCDKTEPCMECVKRNVGHLCTKDERQPRVKRVRTEHNNYDNAKISALRNRETEAEEAAQIIEHIADRETSCTNGYPFTVIEPTFSFAAPDYSNTYWSTTNDPRRRDEELALIREIVDAMPEIDLIRLLYEVFVTRCQGPLGNVTHTPTFMKQADNFCGCLGLISPEARVMALSSTIAMDTLACHLLALVLALAFHPTPSLLGWFPTPLTLRVEEFRASDIHSKTWRSLALRCLQGGVSLFYGSIASLQAAIMLLLDGQEESLALDAILVTAISGAHKLGLHRLGDARLEAWPSPTASSENGSLTSTEPPHIRTEIGIRIWWALVMRDWSHGQALGYYSIHPSQFNTRMPLHINDDDLYPTTLQVDDRSHVIERPRSEFTMLSYTLHALEIAIFARESIDLRGLLRQAQRQAETNGVMKMRKLLNKKYEGFVTGLPSYFRVGSAIGLTLTAGPMAAISVHRWMLHQQLWGLFLRLHRSSLSSQDGRTTCQLLAQNIISTQAQIQARCAVCGSLSTRKTQLFDATVLLLVNSLFSSKDKDEDRSSAQLSRLMTRDKIREAIELLRTRSDAEGPASLYGRQSQGVKASAEGRINALEALMNLEEEESGKNEKSNGASSTRDRPEGQGRGFDGSARKSLKTKVMDILEALQANTRNADHAMEQADTGSHHPLDMSMLSSTADGFQDLDVLPILSNDPSYNIWQFLDFDLPSQPPTANGEFSASADMQALVK